MENKKKIAIVGAGEAAAPIIKKAKEMGIITIAFGGEDSLCKNEVDVFYVADIFNVEKIYEIAKNENVSGVIASSEITTESAAILANKLGLPGNDITIGFAGRNKYDMRCRMQNATYTRQPEFSLYDGQKIELTKNEFRILQTLMEHKGEIVSRDTLMMRLWQMDDYVEENTLTVNVNRLRKKLDGIGLHDYIVTKVGAGYLLPLE